MALWQEVPNIAVRSKLRASKNKGAKAAGYLLIDFHRQAVRLTADRTFHSEALPLNLDFTYRTTTPRAFALKSLSLLSRS